MRRLGQPINDDDEVLQMTIQTVDPDGSGKIGVILSSFHVVHPKFASFQRH